MSSFFLRIYAAFLFLCFWNQSLRAQGSEVPQSKGFVNDYAGIFSFEEERELEDTLQKFFKQSGVQIGLALEESLQGMDVFDRAMLLARTWKIGQKDSNNGILVYIAIKERKYHILVARDMQGDLPDAMVGDMAKYEMVPYIKDDRYFEGCKSIINALKTVAGTGRAYVPSDVSDSESSGFFPSSFWGWLTALIMTGVLVTTWVLGIKKNLIQRKLLNQRGAELGITFKSIK